MDDDKDLKAKQNFSISMILYLQEVMARSSGPFVNRVALFAPQPVVREDREIQKIRDAVTIRLRSDIHQRFIRQPVANKNAKIGKIDWPDSYRANYDPPW